MKLALTLAAMTLAMCLSACESGPPPVKAIPTSSQQAMPPTTNRLPAGPDAAALALAAKNPIRRVLLTVSTEPEGAKITTHGKVLGASPLRILVPLTDYQIALGLVNADLTATWPDGAESNTVAAVAWPPGKPSGTASLLIRRPFTAAERQQEETMRQREAERREDQKREEAQRSDASPGFGTTLLMILLSGAAGAFQGWANSQPHSTSIDCTSRRDGDTTRTSCF